MGIVKSIAHAYNKLTMQLVVGVGIVYVLIVGACVAAVSATFGDGVAAKEIYDKWSYAYENKVAHIICAGAVCKLISIFFKSQLEASQEAEKVEPQVKQLSEAPAASAAVGGASQRRGRTSAKKRK